MEFGVQRIEKIVTLCFVLPVFISSTSILFGFVTTGTFSDFKKAKEIKGQQNRKITPHCFRSNSS